MAGDTSAIIPWRSGTATPNLYTIFDGTSEIQRVVLSSALGSADGGPLNRLFGRGTPARCRVANAALAVRDRVPEPATRMVMKVLAPPRR